MGGFSTFAWRRWIGPVVLAAIAAVRPALAETLPEDYEIDVSASPAFAVSLLGGQTLIATSAISVDDGESRVPLNKCFVNNEGGASGYRIAGGNGQHVEVKYVATTKCSEQMVEVSAFAELKRDGSRVDTALHASCRNCRQTVTPC